MQQGSSALGPRGSQQVPTPTRPLKLVVAWTVSKRNRPHPAAAPGLSAAAQLKHATRPMSNPAWQGDAAAPHTHVSSMCSFAAQPCKTSSPGPLPLQPRLHCCHCGSHVHSPPSMEHNILAPHVSALIRCVKDRTARSCRLCPGHGMHVGHDACELWHTAEVDQKLNPQSWNSPLELAVAFGRCCLSASATAPLEAGAALGGAHARLAARRVRDRAQVPAAIAQRGHAHAGRLNCVHAPLGERNNVAAPLVHLYMDSQSGLQGVWPMSARH